MNCWNRRPIEICTGWISISDLVTESFRYLLRKQTLVQRVQIDPESFRIELIDESGRALPKSRLSEGEKQIFAIAVLWGLAHPPQNADGNRQLEYPVPLGILPLAPLRNTPHANRGARR